MSSVMETLLLLPVAEILFIGSNLDITSFRKKIVIVFIYCFYQAIQRI